MDANGKTIVGPMSLDKYKTATRRLREVPMGDAPVGAIHESPVPHRFSSPSPTGRGKGEGDSELAAIPGEKEFKSDFMADEALQEKGTQLMRDKFEDLVQFDIRFLWKKEGKTRNGKAVLGKTTLPRSYAAYYSKADVLIWVAADHLRALKASANYLEAVLYHELCHVKYDDDPESGGLFLIGHDFEGFVAEYIEYGAWRTDLSKLADELKQLKLL